MSPSQPQPRSSAAASRDAKRDNVVYHDWEASTYDAKWSISFDARCVDYARDRFDAVLPAPATGLPYRDALEIGAGTGFFLLNLAQSGVATRLSLSDISPGMVAAAQSNAQALGLEVDARVADAEHLPFADGSFDLVVGHAVLHHIPDVDRALREVLRVLRPGGRFVFAGEPTKHGDRIVRPLSRATWWASTRAAALPGLRDRWAREPDELRASSHAAALEAVVDLHTFDPAELARACLRAGAVDVSAVTEELTASWFGWPVRTFEAAVSPDRLGRRWAQVAYRTWQGLAWADRHMWDRVVPDAWFYNVSVTGLRPDHD
ncbi:MAG: class I SAM-dependent methyltransferase [Actinomycetota bacterium]|nr:class I SAM-dependent methyltransferase [Actinomycetota bacterium]